MPATYAAVATVLDELQARAPDFAPASMLDAGAGPGTATWAARETWPGLRYSVLVDRNPHLLALAGALAEAGEAQGVEYRSDDLAATSAADAFDLVVAAYSLTELPDAAIVAAAASLWNRTAGALVIVEPGRPRDYARLMGVRTALLGDGAAIVAPCPHAEACPLVAPDWCHFSVRLPRTRDHMRMKGGTLGYEDEKFSYLIVARPALGAGPAAARIVKPPQETKAEVSLELCTSAGMERRGVPSRDRPAVKAARKLRWGDAFG